MDLDETLLACRHEQCLNGKKRQFTAMGRSVVRYSPLEVIMEGAANRGWGSLKPARKDVRSEERILKHTFHILQDPSPLSRQAAPVEIDASIRSRLDTHSPHQLPSS